MIQITEEEIIQLVKDSRNYYRKPQFPITIENILMWLSDYRKNKLGPNGNNLPYISEIACTCIGTREVNKINGKYICCECNKSIIW